MTTSEDTIHVQQLFVKHQSAIKAFVLTLVPHFGDAEDILQETFLTVSKKASEFREGSNFLAWAYAIARIHVLKAQQRGALRTLSPDVVDILSSSAPSENLDELHIKALSECVDRLTPRLRELLERRYHRGQLPSDISRILGRSLNYVNVALTRARTTLRECVQRNLRRQEII